MPPRRPTSELQLLSHTHAYCDPRVASALRPGCPDSTLFRSATAMTDSRAISLCLPVPPVDNHTQSLCISPGSFAVVRIDLVGLESLLDVQPQLFRDGPVQRGFFGTLEHDGREEASAWTGLSAQLLITSLRTSTCSSFRNHVNYGVGANFLPENFETMNGHVQTVLSQAGRDPTRKRSFFEPADLGLEPRKLAS